MPASSRRKTCGKALVAQNLELPGGRIDAGRTELGLRTLGRIQTPRDFEEIIIATQTAADGSKHAVRLKDVATVTDGVEEPRGQSRLDGNVAVSLVVQKQSGGNTVAVADAVKARLAKIQPTLPADIRVEVIRDQSRFIKGSIEEVKFHLALAAFLVSGVIFLFIRDWRTTLIAATAVPTSIIGTFAFMDVMGFTLNNMTMLGLILAVGIVIDDAVVVLENVFRHMEEDGMSGWEAAQLGDQGDRPGGAGDDAVAGGDLRPDRVHVRAGRPVLLQLRLRGRLRDHAEHVRELHADADALRAVPQRPDPAPFPRGEGSHLLLSPGFAGERVGARGVVYREPLPPHPRPLSPAKPGERGAAASSPATTSAFSAGRCGTGG